MRRKYPLVSLCQDFHHFKIMSRLMTWDGEKLWGKKWKPFLLMLLIMCRHFLICYFGLKETITANYPKWCPSYIFVIGVIIYIIRTVLSWLAKSGPCCTSRNKNKVRFQVAFTPRLGVQINPLFTKIYKLQLYWPFDRRAKAKIIVLSLSL